MIELLDRQGLAMDQGAPISAASQRQITQAVQHQYERFPYPPVPVEQEYPGFSVVSSYILGQYARTRLLQHPKGKRALVAGCGTGFEIHGLAVTNPDLEQIIGVDMSQTSVKQAQERLRYHRLRHCEAQVGDLLDPESLPSGPFDLIEAYGVLHHTADPAQALGNLAHRLAPDGILSLMLYNRRGRMLVYHVRETLQRLGVDRLPDDQKIAFVRELLSSFTPGSLLDTYAKQDREYYRHDANIIDNFFHAHDVPFSVAELPDLLDKAGLEFVQIVSPRYEPGSWDPTTIVSPMNRDFYQRYDQLSPIDRLAVIELLNPLKRSENIFWCCHQGARTAPLGFEMDWFRRSSWQLNPLLVAHGQISYLDRLIPWAQLCQTDPTAAQIPVTHLRLHWPLLTTPDRRMVLSHYQLQHLLLPLAFSPQTGAQILDAHPPQLQEHILGCYQRWESHQIVLRAA